MRIKEEITKSGYFWLPSAPDNKVPGTLFITDGGNIELEVVGLFDESIEGLNKAITGESKLDRILGNIEKHGSVTLDNCFYTKKNISFSGISKSLVRVNRALLGAEYDDKETFLFNTFKFSIEGIDEWVGISGIKVDNQFEERTATISYLPPEEITINLNNGMNLLITFSWTLPGFPSTTEAKITQKAYFKLISEQERSIDDFISTAYKITTLLCFAIDRTVSIEHVTATLNTFTEKSSKGEARPVLITLFYAGLPYTKDEPKVERHRMLFRYVQIQDNAELIFNNWFDAYDEIDSALNLYFSAKT